MKQELFIENLNDENGNPAGGSVTGTGISINWQNGPLGRGDDRQEPNGAFVEGVIQAAISRLEYFQASRFSCHENAAALGHLRLALASLELRTKLREERGVEGTHQT